MPVRIEGGCDAGVAQRVHLAFLERHGYVLSEAERQELDRAATDQDAETEAGE
jgi:hypothetical protein